MTIDTPFQLGAIDIVGPISLVSAQGNLYVLTMEDYATRYPDVVPLRSIEIEQVAEALVRMFSRVGVPTKTLSYRDTNFTSDVMKEATRLLSIGQIRTTPCHPMATVLVEKLHGTLNTIVR